MSKQTKTSTKEKGGGESPPRSQTVQLTEQQPAGNQDKMLKEMKEFLANAMSIQTQAIQAMQSELVRHREEITATMQQEHDATRSDIVKAITGISNVVVELDQKVEEVVEAHEKLEAKVNAGDKKFFEMDNKNQRLENEITMLQFRSMEFAIRLRGIKENNREDLRKICSEALAVLLKIDEGEVLQKMDKIYRANSWIAKQRQLPRDVVIYFTERKIRNDIVFNSFHVGLQVQGAEIGIYKELPPKMLRDRKEYGFLVKELQRQQIMFRWDVPVGVILRYQGERYRLNTLDKARQFYFAIRDERPASPIDTIIAPTMNEPETPPLDEKMIEQQIEAEQAQKALEQLKTKSTYAEAAASEGAVGGVSQEEDLLIDFPVVIESSTPKFTKERLSDTDILLQVPKDQRLTRAGLKQLQQKQQQRQQTKRSPPPQQKDNVTKESEVVGGARPKTSKIQQNIRQVLSELRLTKHDT